MSYTKRAYLEGGYAMTEVRDEVTGLRCEDCGGETSQRHLIDGTWFGVCCLSEEQSDEDTLADCALEGMGQVNVFEAQ